MLFNIIIVSSSDGKFGSSSSWNPRKVRAQGTRGILSSCWNPLESPGIPRNPLVFVLGIPAESPSSVVFRAGKSVISGRESPSSWPTCGHQLRTNAQPMPTNAQPMPSVLTSESMQNSLSGARIKLLESSRKRCSITFLLGGAHVSLPQTRKHNLNLVYKHAESVSYLTQV